MLLNTTVNGQPVCLDVPPDTRLIDLLRGPLALTGTKEGCGEGECGACTVLVDGNAVNACMVLAHQVRGKSVQTVEGLAGPDGLSLLQKKFIAHGATQCGFCTPGMLMAATALLRSHAQPSDADIREAIAGNLCRCTGYTAIVQAIRATAHAAGVAPHA
jgi:carbon-monoxide dehydrogenase small subunit